MTTNKFEWGACCVFMLGLVLTLFAFDLTFVVKVSDWLTLGAVSVASYSAWRAYKSHKQLLQPFINAIFRVDSQTGTITFSIENAGGGVAVVKRAFYRYRGPNGNYLDSYELSDSESERNVPNLMRRKEVAPLIESIFRKANDTYVALGKAESFDLNLNSDVFYFTSNNAIAQGQNCTLVSFQCDELKNDSKRVEFVKAVAAHANMFELFIEYKDVTGSSYFKPSKEEYLEFTSSLEIDGHTSHHCHQKSPNGTLQIKLDIAKPSGGISEKSSGQ